MAAGALLLSLFLIPSVSAQMPGAVGEAALHFVVLCPDTLLEPDWAGQDTVTCTIEDLSRDSLTVPGVTRGGTSPSSHSVALSARPRNESLNASGWQVTLGAANVFLVGGQSYPFDVTVKATPQIDTQDYGFEVVALYHGPGGYTREVVVPFGAEVNPYDFALLSWAGPAAQRAGQDDVVIYSLAIENTGVYPDSYRFSIVAPDDLRVTTPPNLFVPPGETRVVNISVLTPHGKLYEIGRSVALTIKVSSVTGTGVYGTTGVLQMRGAYVPVYWIPLVLIGLLSGGLLARDGAQRSERRRLEKGAPRRVDVTPRQEVLLQHLRRTDPDVYKEKRRALDTVYAERVADYRAHRKERLAEDKAEARQARIEFKEQKKLRKEQKKKERIEAKRAKIETRRQRAEVRKKEKLLKKARAKLEKAQAKQAKKDAKLAKKQAKSDAKHAKAAARDEKKRLAAEKKAAKVAAKRQK